MSISLVNLSLIVDGEVYLKDISLDFESGSKTIFLGRTLAGKTSLLRLMAGLDRPTRGKILVNGEDVTGVSVRRRNISMVYQQFINYPSFTVYDNIASPLKVAGMTKKEIDRRVKAVAEMLHLEPILDRVPGELSGGQQQRTAIARALVKESTLLLLDEPLVNLDYKLREELQADLQEIFQRRKAIVVYTTTEPSEALKLGGNIVVLDEGRILQAGITSEVYHRPATIKVAEVFSDPPINLMDCRVDPSGVTLGQGMTIGLRDHLSQLSPGRYIFGLRSNHLYLAPMSAHAVKLSTVVKLAEINGSETFIHVDYAGTRLVVQEVGIYSKKIDSTLNVYINPADFFVFSENGDLLFSPGSNGVHQG